ncbi:MAG: UDP-N-acetylmuramoyl-L-alanyl-D-glutamate--2,6-diaminopimelate ligase [Synergistales bacterium]|nr:UDP-N-acetylmuramoyl-L-alanyl-D-glutamate--2,6-diaminopimelate ligase [Synergistales bacterium]
MVSLDSIIECIDSRVDGMVVWMPPEIDPSRIILSGATSDSREIHPGSLFCCIKGEKHDGHDYAPEAVTKGAVALLCERRVKVPVLQVIVPSVRQVMGYSAGRIYNNPSDHLKMFAITGTNGKSTTAYMIKSILDHSGDKTGLMGTIIYSDGEREVKADRTTPESPAIQQWLSRMVNNGCSSCVMETSSHGLVQGRLNGCLFDCAVFTNLTPEHLDFHGTIENYFEAKFKLFTEFTKNAYRAAINLDDPYGRSLYQKIGSLAIPFGIDLSLENGVSAKDIRMDLEGITFDLLLPGGYRLKDFSLPMTGRYNIYNALASIAAVVSMGVPADSLRSGFTLMPKVPGRLEKYIFSNDLCCVIDYAHTPDALENVMTTLREITRGKLKVVFGLGGNRYQKNRPLMGKVAARYADEITVTMDNPRDEDPADIAEQIIEGIRSTRIPFSGRVILDREEAVRYTLSGSDKDDVVLIAGKGPETHIIWGERRIPYNDTTTVLKWARDHGLEWR